MLKCIKKIFKQYLVQVKYPYNVQKHLCECILLCVILLDYYFSALMCHQYFTVSHWIKLNCCVVYFK